MSWTASVIITTFDEPDIMTRVTAIVHAKSEKECLKGAEHILNTMAAGKIAHIREKPCASSEKDFDTKEVTHNGYVRFSYLDRPGDWTYSDSATMVPFR
jgi:hypothetical protein